MFNSGNILRRSLGILALFLLFAFFHGGTGWAQDLPSLFTVTANEMAVRRIPGLMPDKISVTVDFSLITPSNVPITTLRAPLPDSDVVLLRDRIETRGADNYTWIGRVEGHELSTAVITVVNGVAVGHIDFDGQNYSLNLSNKGYQLV